MNHSFNSPELDDKAIAEAIRVAESETSAEIRVFVSNRPCDDPKKSARHEFVRLEMFRTPLRNGILLYVAPQSNAFAVCCDESVQFRCGHDFETQVVAAAMPALLAGQIEPALVSAIRCSGALLAKNFPLHSLDRNDLPDTVLRD